MQDTTSENQKEQTTFTPLVPSSSDSQQPVENQANTVQPGSQQSFFYYTQNDEPDFPLPLVDERDDQADHSSPFVLPFQNSAAMPTIATMDVQHDVHEPGPRGVTPPPAISAKKTHRVSLRLVKILLIATVVLITVAGASFFVFAQSPTLLVPTSRPTGPSTSPIKTSTVPTGSSSKTTNNPPPSNQNQGQGTQAAQSLPSSTVPSIQFLNQIGWTQAGLSFGDAVEVLRTGDTFTDREMSFDYRSIGTLTAHGGTLTSSTFLLTPGGKIRFVQNDKRMVNNDLYNQIHTGKIIQQVVNAQPSLVQFQMILVQGQQRAFAWVNVAFEVFQSKIVPANGKRSESLERDTATGQPLVHHLAVVLVRVSPQNQGANAPMGGTGWLVNTYALDTNTLPAIETLPTL